MLTESFPANHGSLKHSSSRKTTYATSHRDLWSVAREGSVSDLDTALLLLKKNGGNIDTRNAVGLTPLHIATWRNNVPIVTRLLAAGADPDARDGESGWSSLHRALHFGHLAVASALLQFGASLTLEDSKFRTPVDLISGPVLQASGNGRVTVATEVFSWGSGTNYQLGTGNAHIQKLPCKVDELQGTYIRMTASAKFHSVAVGDDGKLYTWGFGRGGRLGHPDFDIHSGQAAVITPRQVNMGSGSPQVKAIAVAKHHTIIATENGDVFTWGSNREGQLGYTSVDTQPIPRRVSSIRSKIISVAAANKHSAAVADNGEVFTWGCNKEGQLGYGTSNSASNYTPRVVEYLKGKAFTVISAAKYHTIVLSTDGEVFTWGHRLVTPRRVIIARNLKKSGNIPLKFHRTEKLHVISLAAGAIHSMALTDDGTLFYWVSADPNLRCRQVYSLCGRKLVSISAGKFWSAAVTDTGDVYMWDGKKNKGEDPIPSRLHGIKNATSVSVGETHLLAVCAFYYPIFSSQMEMVISKTKVLEQGNELEELDENFIFNYTESINKLSDIQNEISRSRTSPSLKSLCEKTVIEFILEPRNALQLLEVADSLAADELRSHCEEMAIRNLAFIFTVATSTITSASPYILATLEKIFDARSSESWCYRHLPTPTATFPAVIDIVDEGVSREGYVRIRDHHVKPMLKNYGDARKDCFLDPKKDADHLMMKEVRALKKKLQQVEVLEEKLSKGHILDDQQIVKLQTRDALERALADICFPVERDAKVSVPVVSEGKGNKTESSRKQRKKGNQKDDQVVISCEKNAPELRSAKDVLNIGGLQILEKKEDALTSENDKSSINENEKSSIRENFSLRSPKGTPRNNNYIKTKQTHAKKNKKGGLSIFLSGGLDDHPIEAPPPTPPKKEGPAWGGTKVSKGSTSLREIQDEQTKTTSVHSLQSKKSQLEDLVVSKSPGHIQLSSFLLEPLSGSIAIMPSRVVPQSDADKSTPPWSGNSPVTCRPSLREIQLQQEKKQNISRSPKTRTTGFTVSSGQTSSESTTRTKDTVPNRWFKPEMDAPSSIRSIQIEEKAMKDLKRYYTNVRLVNPQSEGSIP